MPKELSNIKKIKKAILFFLFGTEHMSGDLEKMLKEIIPVLEEDGYIESEGDFFYPARKILEICPELKSVLSVEETQEVSQDVDGGNDDE